MNPAQFLIWLKIFKNQVSGGFLPLSGGTMTGPIVLAADPVNPLEAATKQYVDNHAHIPNVRSVAASTNADFTLDLNNIVSFTGASPSTYTINDNPTPQSVGWRTQVVNEGTAEFTIVSGHPDVSLEFGEDATTLIRPGYSVFITKVSTAGPIGTWLIDGSPRVIDGYESEVMIGDYQATAPLAAVYGMTPAGATRRFILPAVNIPETQPVIGKKILIMNESATFNLEIADVDNLSAFVTLLPGDAVLIWPTSVASATGTWGSRFLVPQALTYYEYFESTLTFTGPWAGASNPVVTYRVLRMGRSVLLILNPVIATGNNTVASIQSGLLPTRFFASPGPTQLIKFLYNGSTVTGELSVGTTIVINLLGSVQPGPTLMSVGSSGVVSIPYITP